MRYRVAATSLIGVAAVVAIGILDARTGELRLSILYVLVVVAMSWVNGRASGLLFTAASIVAVVLANTVYGDRHIGDPHFLLSTASDLVVFAFCAVGTTSLRDGLVRERAQRRNLARYLPAAFVDRLAEEGLGAQMSRHYGAATVMFVDIRGFTRLSLELSPGELFERLQSYRQIVSASVAAHGGFVDKFIGDGALAVFGIADAERGSAGRALAAALDLLSGMAALNERRCGAAAMPIGIGLHTGDVIAGAIGDEERLEFTVLGDTVNLAARIEDLTRDFNLPLLMSEAVYRALPPERRDGGDWAFFSVLSVRGVSGPIELAYLVDMVADPQDAVRRVSAIRAS